MPLYFYGLNNTLLLLILAVFVLGLVAQAGVGKAYNKYAKEPSRLGMPASEMATRMLQANNSSVQVMPVRGKLTDHYDPRTDTVGLSEAVYNSSSVAALAVAAHEIGHVMQYQEGYLPIRIRNVILPVASFGSYAAPVITILGALMGSYNLAMIGVWLFLGILVFQVITLPVELNASRRAIALLEAGDYIAPEEEDGARRVLRAAAMTYVVAVLAALVSFLRLLFIARGSRR